MRAFLKTHWLTLMLAALVVISTFVPDLVNRWLFEHYAHGAYDALVCEYEEQPATWNCMEQKIEARYGTRTPW